jgi:hypothetical protein
MHRKSFQTEGKNLSCSGVASKVAIGQLPPKPNFIAT